MGTRWRRQTSRLLSLRSRLPVARCWWYRRICWFFFKAPFEAILRSVLKHSPPLPFSITQERNPSTTTRLLLFFPVLAPNVDQDGASVEGFFETISDQASIFISRRYYRNETHSLLAGILGFRLLAKIIFFCRFLCLLVFFLPHWYYHIISVKQHLNYQVRHYKVYRITYSFRKKNNFKKFFFSILLSNTQSRSYDFFSKFDGECFGCYVKSLYREDRKSCHPNPLSKTEGARISHLK